MGNWEQILKELAENDFRHGGFIKSALDELESLRARVQELEAGMGEPVAWMTYPHLGVAGEEHLWGVSAKTSERKLADSWERKGWKVHPLFRTPPAVAAALMKAAEVCWSRRSVEGGYCAEEILAIPHDDSALLELIERGILEGIRVAKSGEEFNLAASSSRVLGEKK